MNALAGIRHDARQQLRQGRITHGKSVRIIEDTTARRAVADAKDVADQVVVVTKVLQGLAARVVAEIDRAVANYGAVQDQLREGDQLVQAEGKQLQAIAAALQAGGADQLEWRTGQAEAALAELARLDILVKAQQAIGQVEDALQRPFEALSVIEQAGRGPARKEKP